MGLSLWLAHTHHSTAPSSSFLWLKPWQMGCSKLEGRTVLIRSLLFLSLIKILIFSLGSSRWSGASVCCWDDEGFGKTAKVHVHLKPLRSSSQYSYLPLLKKWETKQRNEEENDIIVKAHSYFCHHLSLSPYFCSTFYFQIYHLGCPEPFYRLVQNKCIDVFNVTVL